MGQRLEKACCSSSATCNSNRERERQRQREALLRWQLGFCACVLPDQQNVNQTRGSRNVLVGMASSTVEYMIHR
jgi:hypothetical protein